MKVQFIAQCDWEGVDGAQGEAVCWQAAEIMQRIGLHADAIADLGALLEQARAAEKAANEKVILLALRNGDCPLGAVGRALTCEGGKLMLKARPSSCQLRFMLVI